MNQKSIIFLVVFSLLRCSFWSTLLLLYLLGDGGWLAGWLTGCFDGSVSGGGCLLVERCFFSPVFLYF
jgi:hypothetical protein